MSATGVADLGLGAAPVKSSAASVFGAAVPHTQPAARVATAAAASPGMRRSDSAVFAGIVLIIVVAFLKIVLRRRLSSRHTMALDVVIVLFGFMLLLMMRLPINQHSGWIGASLFIALPVLYRLLGYFEEPEDKV